MGKKKIVPNFTTLVADIQKVHVHMAAQAGRAVNVALTLRNWTIGAYIDMYELRGADRAEYGDGLLARLSDELTKKHVGSCGRRQLYNYLKFYQTYPEIALSATAHISEVLPGAVIESIGKVRSLPALSQTDHINRLESLSYTHFEQLIAIEHRPKRDFYEIACLRGNWSVRELKRQINSLYYERSSLSRDKSQLAELVESRAERTSPALEIRDPYIFEFLGIRSKEVMHESDLEDALLDKLQDFLLELGHGVCFEARQKRILIGESYCFVDLVFYHRILKCHVLIDLKIEGFTHENLGQLNTYVSWYRKNIMTTGDNPPVGILLCTQKDHALVEYALAGMDNNLFVSKYQLALPGKAEIQQFLESSIRSTSQS